MGPYCNFCGTRCFVPVMPSDDSVARAVYGANRIDIGATCQGGIALERERLGISLAESRRSRES